MLDTFPVLTTERLNLIEIGHQHLYDIFKLFGNEQVTRFYNLTTFTDESEAQKIIERFHKRYLENAGIRWGIALKNQPNIIGTIGFNNYSQRHRANLGYDLHPDYWNKGFMKEALTPVLRFGFINLEVNRIEAEVMQGNIASEKLLAATGFLKEGVLKQWMHWNDNYYDMVMYALLRSEFKI